MSEVNVEIGLVSWEESINIWQQYLNRDHFWRGYSVVVDYCAERWVKFVTNRTNKSICEMIGKSNSNVDRCARADTMEGLPTGPLKAPQDLNIKIGRYFGLFAALSLFTTIDNTSPSNFNQQRIMTPSIHLAKSPRQSVTSKTITSIFTRVSIRLKASQQEETVDVYAQMVSGFVKAAYSPVSSNSCSCLDIWKGKKSIKRFFIKRFKDAQSLREDIIERDGLTG